MELKCNGVCNVAADADFKQINEKFCLANVNLVFNRRFKKAEEWQEEATFIKGKILGNKAVRFSEVAKKGSRLFVEGYICQENWKDKDGKDRSALVLNIDHYEVCEKQSNGSSENKTQSAPKNTKVVSKPKATTKVVATEEANDDEMPF